MSEEEAIAGATAFFQRYLGREIEAGGYHTPERLRVMQKALSLIHQVRKGGDEESYQGGRDLCQLINDLLDGKIPHARRGKGTYARDLQIVMAIHTVVEAGSFAATRSEATDETVSACSIVANALANVGIHLSEKRMANIWSENAWRR